MRPGLLVIDMQQAFYDSRPAVRPFYESATRYINAAQVLFEKKKLPVIHIYHQDDEDGLIPGTAGFEFFGQIEKTMNGYKVIKTFGNAFNKTGLLDIVKQEKLDSLILTGFCAEYCVMSTYNGANDLCLNPIVLRGALASGKSEHMRFVQDICELISFDVLKFVLKDLPE